MNFPSLKNLVKGGTEGIISGITDGAANIISKLKADPTKALEYEKDLEELKTNANLKAMEIANEAEKIEVEKEKAYLADVSDARNMNKAIQADEKASWMSKNIAYCLDVLFVTAFITMLVIILYKQVPEENKEIFYTAFGLLGGYVSTIINFHRGTSIGSKTNGDALRKIAVK